MSYPWVVAGLIMLSSVLAMTKGPRNTAAAMTAVGAFIAGAVLAQDLFLHIAFAVVLVAFVAIWFLKGHPRRRS
jgi:uncharacterized membrane protein